MNVKIKELAEEAGFMEGWFSESGDDCEREIKKFAELIVKECILICKSHKIQSTEDVWYLAHNETVNNISENIEEYFGVEE